VEKLLNISAEIEQLVEKHQIDYIDACMLYCERHNLDVEQFAMLIRNNQNIKSKLQVEAEQLNFLKKQPRIEFDGE
jgi:hypothetical protein